MQKEHADQTPKKIHSENPTLNNGAIRSNHPFEFTGRAGEYFRIWIVNVCLSIVTLGIYSAWAKVRTKRYFYGNTILAGSAFDYTAEPIKILKGRILAVALFVAYSLINSFAPTYSSIAFFVVIILLPMIIVLSMRFRNYNSVWRGIRFGFRTNFKKAYFLFSPPIIYFGAIALLPFFFDLGLSELASLESDPPPSDEEIEALIAKAQPYFITVGVAALVAFLLFPWWQKKYYDFIGNNSRYGSEPFKLESLTIEFYSIYIFAGLLAIGSVFVIGLGVGLLGQALNMAWLTPLLVFLPYAIVVAYVITKRTNVIYSNLTIDDITFNCELDPGKMVFLYTTNTLAILCTLGMAIPWAMVRVARYRASCINLRASNLDTFISKQSSQENAVGEEVGEIFGLDIGL